MAGCHAVKYEKAEAQHYEHRGTPLQVGWVGDVRPNPLAHTCTLQEGANALPHRNGVHVFNLGQKGKFLSFKVGSVARPNIYSLKGVRKSFQQELGQND